VTVLDMGATGNAGSGLVAACLARGLAVRAAVRGGRREGTPEGAEVAAFDFADPSPHLGQAHAPTGQESPTFHDVARILTEELGRPIRYEPVSVPRYLRHLRRNRGLGWGQALLYSRLHVGLRWGEGNRPTPDLPRLLGHAPRTMRDYVRDHRELWLPDLGAV
jgi:uncharacterized protein YbjT (DUF2867 family)